VLCGGRVALLDEVGALRVGLGYVRVDRYVVAVLSYVLGAKILCQPCCGRHSIVVRHQPDALLESSLAEACAAGRRSTQAATAAIDRSILSLEFEQWCITTRQKQVQDTLSAQSS
jgi:hypothetical protein